MNQTPAASPVRLAVGITGHRGGNATPIAAVLAQIFTEIEEALAADQGPGPDSRLGRERDRAAVGRDAVAEGIEHANPDRFGLAVRRAAVVDDRKMNRQRRHCAKASIPIYFSPAVKFSRALDSKARRSPA